MFDKSTLLTPQEKLLYAIFVAEEPTPLKKCLPDGYSLYPTPYIDALLHINVLETHSMTTDSFSYTYKQPWPGPDYPEGILQKWYELESGHCVAWYYSKSDAEPATWFFVSHNERPYCHLYI